jgi:anti-sigma regulatory factor (Ser/Thr protein kinase)
MSAGKIFLELKNEPSEFERLNRTLAEFAERHHLSAKVLFDMTLALEEILTNVISYGYDDGKEHQILVRLALEKGNFTAEVADDGRPFDPLAVPEPDTEKPVEERPVGGLGIHLARKLMDGFEYKRQGNKNLLIMKKKTEEG